MVSKGNFAIASFRHISELDCYQLQLNRADSLLRIKSEQFIGCLYP